MQFCDSCDNLLKAKQENNLIVAYCDYCGYSRSARDEENFTISYLNNDNQLPIEVTESNSSKTIQNRKCSKCQTESLIYQEIQPDRFNDEQSEVIVYCTNCNISFREGRG